MSSEQKTVTSVVVDKGVVVPIRVSRRYYVIRSDVKNAARDAGVAGLAAMGVYFGTMATTKASEADFLQAFLGILFVGLISLLRRWLKGPPKQVEIKT